MLAGPSRVNVASSAPTPAKVPFALYVQKCRREYEAINGPNHPADFSFKDFIFNCSDNWHNKLTAEERSTFIEDCREDKERYEREYKAYSERRALINPIKKGKHSYAPFYYFCEGERSAFQEKYPKLSHTDLAVKMGEAWLDAKIDVRRRYEAIARERNPDN